MKKKNLQYIIHLGVFAVLGNSTPRFIVDHGESKVRLGGGSKFTESFDRFSFVTPKQAKYARANSKPMGLGQTCPLTKNECKEISENCPVHGN